MIRIEDYAVKTAATTEPISLTEAKLHLRVDHTTDDNLITALITAAREMVEKYTGRVLITSTWYGYSDTADTDGFEITMCPVTAVSAITYNDASNVSQTWASTNYILNATRTPARVGLSASGVVPSTFGGNHDWRVEFVAGYANAAAVPSSIKSAILLQIGHLYEHREAVIIGATPTAMPLSVEFLLTPWIVWR